MKQVFENASQVQVVFTDEGITFCGRDQEVYFPYGSVGEISMSLMGILQVTHHPQVCTFAVDRKDRAGVKEMIRFAKAAMKTAEPAQVQVIDRAASELSPAEQLKQLKAQFIQGAISKEEYDARKQLLKG